MTVNLSILSVEKEIAAGIDLTSVVREFAEATARRVKLKTIMLYCRSLKEL